MVMRSELTVTVIDSSEDFKSLRDEWDRLLGDFGSASIPAAPCVGLNQIELWFSILERQCLKRASTTTYRQMAHRIIRFARQWDRTARPFRWTFKGYPFRR